MEMMNNPEIVFQELEKAVQIVIEILFASNFLLSKSLLV